MRMPARLAATTAAAKPSSRLPVELVTTTPRNAPSVKMPAWAICRMRRRPYTSVSPTDISAYMLPYTSPFRTISKISMAAMTTCVPLHSGAGQAKPLGLLRRRREDRRVVDDLVAAVGAALDDRDFHRLVELAGRAEIFHRPGE